MDDNPDGGGRISGMEERAVQAAEESHPEDTSNIEALNIGLSLDQIMNGMNSILSRMDKSDEEGLELREVLNRVKERLAKMEAAQEKWEAEQDKILQHSMEISEGVDPSVRAEAQARAAKEVQSIAAGMKVNTSLERLAFKESLKEMPQEEIISAGKVVMISGQGGFPQPRLYNEQIRMNGMVWTLPAGQAVKVPQVVADRYRQMKIEEQELTERRHVLSATERGKHRHEGTLAQQWDAINVKYGSPADAIPMAGDELQT